LELYPTDYSHNGWTNALHLTIGEGLSNYGDRTPAIFFHPANKMYVSSAVNGNKDFVKSHINRPPVNQWTTLEISQQLISGKYFYFMKVGGTEVFREENKVPSEFSGVKVYASSPWQTATPALVRCLKIETGNRQGNVLPYISV
jgi:hypothetical protein